MKLLEVLLERVGTRLKALNYGSIPTPRVSVIESPPEPRKFAHKSGDDRSEKGQFFREPRHPSPPPVRNAVGHNHPPGEVRVGCYMCVSEFMCMCIGACCVVVLALTVLALYLNCIPPYFADDTGAAVCRM